MIKITGGRSLWPLAAGAVVLAAATACQSSPDPTPPAAAPATAPTSRPAVEPADRGPTVPARTTSQIPTTSPPRPVPRCHTADLTVEVGQPDSATGHTGLTLTLVNRSAHRCRIKGYGGIQLLDATGTALPTHQDRAQPTPTAFILRPGGRAHSSLFWISMADAVPCFSASGLLVTPPDETESLRAPFTHTICGNGVISQGAYRPDPT